MVDFNAETTIGTPAVDIERVLILQYRAEAIEALGHYEKLDAQNVTASTHTIRAALFKLLMQLHGGLARKLKPKEFEELRAKIRSHKIDQLQDAYMEISEYLDSLRLTRIDSRPNYDTTNPELSNKAKGL